MNFYPRSPCGERQRAERTFQVHLHFYPRSPCGERHFQSAVILIIQRFLSTLSLRRATGSKLEIELGTVDFYPRSPCGERLCRFVINASQSEFLSTLSLRRATACAPLATNGATDFYPRSPCGERHNTLRGLRRCTANFYPRSPCGERLPASLLLYSSISISIHALLAESD